MLAYSVCGMGDGRAEIARTDDQQCKNVHVDRRKYYEWIGAAVMGNYYYISQHSDVCAGIVEDGMCAIACVALMERDEVFSYLLGKTIDGRSDRIIHGALKILQPSNFINVRLQNTDVI